MFSTWKQLFLTCDIVIDPEVRNTGSWRSIFNTYSQGNCRAERMKQVGKARTGTPSCYNILEEYSYSGSLEELIVNETSVVEDIKIDPEVCLNWRKGRRVVELSILADKMFCKMCQTE